MRKFTIWTIVSLLLCSFTFGQAPKASPETDEKTKTEESKETVPTGLDKLTATDVEAFLDGILPLQLARDNVAGATVSVVKDGKLLFAKGYGYRDVEKKLSVVADKTLFRPGSVSKLFVWTAVMQLVEQGKLELNKDINEYLDFKIPEAFGKPITLKDILTHTPGFEEQIKDLFVASQEPPNLENYVKTHIPRRIFPPGTVPAYSNYGTALAGYIVQRVAEQDFNEYLEEHIFRPLEMNDSTFVQPLPERLAKQMSQGYLLASGESKSFEFVNAFPAGSLSSTSTDMAKFMIAHLQEGKYGDAQILKPETAKLMHSRLFALDDSANAMLHGFYEQTANGQRAFGHGGDTIQFHSNLHLLTDSGVGLFISYNSQGNGQVSSRDMLFQAFLDRYYPFTGEEMATLESAKENAAKVSGTYMVSRRAEGSLFRLLAILGEASVYANDDDTISVNALLDPNGLPKRFAEVAPMTFQDVKGHDKVIFKPDEDGRMQLVIGYPFMVFKRVGLFQNGKLILPVVGVSLGIMLLTLILWFVAWWIRRHYGRKLELSRLDWWLRIGVRIVFALNLIFVISLVSYTIAGISNLELLGSSGVKWIILMQIVGLLGALGTFVVIFNAIRTWMNKKRGIWIKLQATVFVLACFGFLWLVYVGNLLSFTSAY